MNNKDNQAVAAKGFKDFIELMSKASLALNVEFSVTNEDDDMIDFEMDGYHFSLSWGEILKDWIGDIRVWAVEYQLAVYHTINNFSRDNPPEEVDTTLLDSTSIRV